MSSNRSAVSSSEYENIIKMSHMSVTLEKKTEVIHRMKSGQPCPNVPKSMKLPPSTVELVYIINSASQSAYVG
jgi:hypothetical protein